MVKAVLDTTTLATFTTARENSLMRVLAKRWLIEEAFQVILSAYIYNELQEVLQKKYFQSRLTPAQISAYLQAVKESSRMIEIKSHIVGVAAHPKDDPIVATAIDGNVHYLVTGDKPLQRISLQDKGIIVISPVDFLLKIDEINRREREQVA